MEGTAKWVHNPAADVALALCWIPFAVVGHLLEASPHSLDLFLAGVFLLSFSHQPLTLALVYGDPAQFALRRRLFTWSPVVFAAALLIGLHVSLAAVAAVAGLWNAEHTLMQRYGITRIYGRKGGDDNGPVERAMLLSWLVLALVWVAADARTPGFLHRVDLGAVNHDGVAILGSLRPVASWLLLPVLLVVAVLASRWLRAERSLGARRNPAKHFYLGSTAALFVVILVDPIAGLLAYVGSHAIEYFAVVHQSLGRRYASEDGGVLGRAVRAPTGRLGFYAAYIGAVVGLTTVLRIVASDTLYSVCFLTFGGLHVFYDGFIWKLRRPVVAKGFALASAPAPAPA